MKTHTIAWNCDKTKRIVTFKEIFFDKLLKSHPRAVCLFLDKLIDSLNKPGKSKYHMINYDQEQLLSPLLEIINKQNKELTLSDKERHCRHMITEWLSNGVRLNDVEPELLLCYLNRFFDTYWDLHN